ncbi:Mch1p [Sugiyamaella lignohabitans]|uniref:Probable transporter MCH1 n=1 Tax=Sugiyamaella lignohabitans TaxID=796027 RepID=A0A161HHU0_9ASCO|nr:Mch1p [Sugiyamaella lignohabitans]ANB15660.1 Mch1p [Sugiyamaella lignohabitans]
MYFPVPLLGYAGDKHGQSKLSLFSAALFTPAYLVSAYVYSNHGSYKLLAGSFALVGTATSALYVSALVTCARMYPHSTGLAISAPVSAFGISSLWLSQVIPKLFRTNAASTDSALNVTGIFIFFAFMYLVMGVVGYIAAKLGDVDGSDVSKKSSTEGEDEPDTSEQRLSSEGNLNSHPSDHLTQRERLKVFIVSHETWLLMLAFVLTSGPLEMYLNNIGAIIDTMSTGRDLPYQRLDVILSAPSSANNVSIFSAFSTIARLSVGVFSDIVRPRLSTAMVLTIIVFTTAIAHFLLALGVFAQDAGRLFYISSMINGFSYGALFTLYPTMVACVWGVKSFGTNWGLFILGPAIGSVIYGILFGAIYQRATSGLTCAGNDCYEITFLVSGSGIVVASLVIFYLWHYSWKHNTLIQL